MTEPKPLNVTQEGNHRIFVGLGWDPNENPGFKDKALNTLGLKDIHHDLDLSCYIYDQNARYISHVSHEAGREVDQTGKIYHSGDNTKGVGDGDDEQISVELKEMDDAIHTIIFKASIKTGHTFDQVNDPEIRLVDAYSRREFLHVPLSGLKDNQTSAFIFAALLRSPDGSWQVRHVGEFIDKPADGQWADILKTYL